MNIGTLLGGLVGLSFVAVLILWLTRRGAPGSGDAAEPSDPPDARRDEDESDKDQP